MRKVYLCGPINGCSDEQAKGWRDTAAAALAGKYEVLDPMRRDYRGKEAGNEGNIVRDDLKDIRTADVILANVARPSWGTAMEIYAAGDFGRALIYGFNAPENPSPWLVAHCDDLFPDLDGALAHLLRANDRSQ